MEGRRFDAIARASAGVSSRRGLLRAIAALVLGDAAFDARDNLTRARSQGAAACVQDADCLDGEDSCTGAACDGGRCTYFIVSCLPEYGCCGNGACCAEAERCQSDLDCAQTADDPCAGASCANGLCVPYLLTCAPGFACCKGTCAVSCGDASIDSP